MVPPIARLPQFPMNIRAGLRFQIRNAASGAVVTDVRQFCVRQPDACAIGSQALVDFGHKAQNGAKMLYDFLGEKVGREPARGSAEQVAGARKPSQNTLTPADLALPWRGPPPRRNPDARHPA